MENFGTLLRRFRKRCKNPDDQEQLLSQAKLGELVGGFSGASISDWERGVTNIHADQLPLLLSIIRVLQKWGGMNNPTEANTLLSAGNYRSLSPEEIDSIFTGSISSASNENSSSINLWPPGIPDEDYHPLPNREAQFSGLMKLLGSHDGPTMISIDGLGGMGKTATAAELARRCVAKGLFQGVIGETAKQEMLTINEIIPLQPPMLNYETLLDALARQLQLWDLFTRDVQTRESVLSQILRSQRHLIFVDNLESVENVNVLLSRLGNILGASRAIITSRVKVGPGFAHSHTLEGLDLPDSLQFIHSIAARLDVKQIQDTGEKMLTEMWQLTGGSPLAIKLAVAQAKFVDLDHILKQMHTANNNLYFFIFKDSWEQLSETAQKILVYIGKTVVETVGLKELSIIGFTESETELVASLEQLITLSLMDVYYIEGKIRYGIHQLTRQFINQDLPAIWKAQGLL
jgi:hypothetical protein